MELETTSKSYFSNLNALAQKIAADIQNTQEAYQDLWYTLSKKEQNQAIDESIINPSAVLKYATSQVQPLNHNSNLYSWFTKSQLNLNLYDKLDSRGYLNSKVDVLSRSDCDQCFKPTPIEKVIPMSNSIDCNSDEVRIVTSLRNTGEKTLGKTLKGSVLKPKNPPPPPPKVTTPTTENDAIADGCDFKSNDIPKTGFDFLDNW